MRAFLMLWIGLSVSAASATDLCGTHEPTSATTYEASAANFLEQTSGPMAIALSGVVTFPDFRRTLEAMKPQSLCSTAIVIGKNDYGYNTVLIQVEVLTQDNEFRVIPMLFQTASVQAYEHQGPKPWLGLSVQDMQETMTAAIGSIEFKAVDLGGQDFHPLMDLKQLRPSFGPAERADQNTLSYTPLYYLDSRYQYFLVSQMASMGSATNIFAAVHITRGVVIRRDIANGEVSAAPLPSLFNVAQELTDNLKRSNPGTTDLIQRVDHWLHLNP